VKISVSVLPASEIEINPHDACSQINYAFLDVTSVSSCLFQVTISVNSYNSKRVGTCLTPVSETSFCIDI